MPRQHALAELIGFAEHHGFKPAGLLQAQAETADTCENISGP